MTKPIAGAAVGFLLGVLGNLLATWIQGHVLQDSFTPFWGVIIVLLTIVGIVIGARLDQPDTRSRKMDTKGTNRAIYWILTALVIGAVVVTGLAVVLSGRFRTEPSTIYFVVDASEKMRPVFEDVRTQVQVAASAVREDSRIGLRIYGGGSNTISACQDSQRLLEPSAYPQAQELLGLVLAGVEPRGHSSMTGAILEALHSDLQEEDRPVRMILVTSGIDPLCDPPAGDFLKDRAKDIGRDVELLIIGIGEQDAGNHRILESYAQAFHGIYLQIPNAESLPPVIRSVSFYGYGYGYPFYGQEPMPEQ